MESIPVPKEGEKSARVRFGGVVVVCGCGSRCEGCGCGSCGCRCCDCGCGGGGGGGDAGSAAGELVVAANLTRRPSNRRTHEGAAAASLILRKLRTSTARLSVMALATERRSFDWLFQMIG